MQPGVERQFFFLGSLLFGLFHVALILGNKEAIIVVVTGPSVAVPKRGKGMAGP